MWKKYLDKLVHTILMMGICYQTLLEISANKVRFGKTNNI